jgi:NADH-quinone oxidoreductase subunit B
MTDPLESQRAASEARETSSEHEAFERRAGVERPGFDVTAGLGVGSDDSTQMAADHPGNQPGALAMPGTSAVAEPIVVPNQLWAPADPAAYGGGRPADITHLTEVGLTDLERRDDARWSGLLDVIPTKADYVLDLLRANSLWPLLSGLACCAIEMMSFATSKNDIDRWGAFPFRASPRQADVLIVAGTLTTKMAGPLLRLWEQMPEPKWCVAMGDCTCSGGRYKRSYSTVEGIDRIMPVDIYVPGCPPRPEGLIFGMMKLQQLVKDRRGHWPERAIGATVPAGV